MNNQETFAVASFTALTSDIVLPVPSSIVMYLNGAVLGLLPGALLSIASVMISSVIGYIIGLVSEKIMNKNGTHRTSNELLEKTGPLAIILTRGIPILSESIIIVAGYNRVSFGKFLLWNTIGYVPVCFTYSYLGSISSSQNAFLISFGVSIAISFAFWMIGRRVLNAKSRSNA
jgi:uncharacterized membrane protein YdjX (TVP38/TMEM64 family)